MKKQQWIVYAIEGNSEFNAKLDKMKIILEKKGHTVVLLKETVADIYNGNVTFFKDVKNTKDSYSSNVSRL